MKRYLGLFLLLGLSLNLFAQNQFSRISSKCKNIYVWDFLDQDKNKNRTTNDITEAIEEALTNIDECFVLQRRNLANLVNHAAAEKGINSVKEMKYEITHALAGSGAKLVLFGTVDMSARDACEVRLRIEDLTTSRIVTAKSTRVLYADIANIDNRNRVMYKLVSELIGKPYVAAARTKQDNIINPPASQTKKIFTISSKNDLNLIVGECTGNAYNQTVTINFTFMNNSANLKFTMPSSMSDSFAGDLDGNQYSPTSFSLGGQKQSYGSIDKEFYTGTKLRASMTFGNILPGVKRLAVIKIPFYTVLSGKNDYLRGEVTFRDVDINWQ